MNSRKRAEQFAKSRRAELISWRRVSRDHNWRRIAGQLIVKIRYRDNGEHLTCILTEGLRK